MSAATIALVYPLVAEAVIHPRAAAAQLAALTPGASVATVQLLAAGERGPAGPAGPQGPAGASAAGYLHNQSSASSVWTINHNLGFKPGVTLYTVGGAEFEAEVTHTSDNQCVVSLAALSAGYARCS